MSIHVQRNRPESWAGTWYTLILRVLVLAALAYVLYRVAPIIVMVLVSAMLALTLARPVDWLQESRLLLPLPRHLRRGVATTIVFVAAAIALLGLIFIVVRPLALEIKGFLYNWKMYQEQLGVRMDALRKWYEDTLPPETRGWIEPQVQAYFKERGSTDLGSLISTQLNHLTRQTAEKGMFLIELILIPVLAWSFLTESRPLKKEIVNLLPRTRVRDGLYVLRQTGSILQSYAIGQLILALIAGVVVYAMLVALQIPGALALAVVAAITRVIPVIGPLVGGIPIVLFSTLRGWQEGVLVLILFTILHVVESKVVMPRLIGYRINLHPAVVIIVLLIGAEFFGMWGMFLAAPVAAVVKVLLHHFFVRPRKRQKPPAGPQPGAVVQKESELERPAVAGVRTHSRAH